MENSPDFTKGILIDTWQCKHVAEEPVDPEPEKEVTHVLMGNERVSRDVVIGLAMVFPITAALIGVNVFLLCAASF